MHRLGDPEEPRKSCTTTPYFDSPAQRWLPEKPPRGSDCGMFSGSVHLGGDEMDKIDDLGPLQYRRRKIRRMFTAGLDYTAALWGREMDMEFIDRVARETVVPDWWFPFWDLGVLWSSWAPLGFAMRPRSGSLRDFSGVKDPTRGDFAGFRGEC